MQEPYPYKKYTVNIDETNPIIPQKSRSLIEGIAIVPNQKNFATKANELAISESLQSIENPDTVKAFVIDYDSNLKKTSCYRKI